VPGAPGLSTLTTILWLLGAGGAICVLLRGAIDGDDRSRALAGELARERRERELAESMLRDTQTVLSRVVRQQDAQRDSERDRIARDIQDDLGQTLLSLRVDMSLLQVASNGVHPSVHQKTGAMVRTLDLALRSLRALLNGLRPLAANEDLHGAMARQLDEFTRLTGIRHSLDATPGPWDDSLGNAETDALLYRVLQEVLGNIAAQASATEVRVNLHRAGEQLTLGIHDDGLDCGERGQACGCGLSSMRPRIEALGGALLVAAAPGSGTLLTLNLPAGHGMAIA
jgi:signal transduction histidine kinase